MAMQHSGARFFPHDYYLFPLIIFNHNEHNGYTMDTMSFSVFRVVYISFVSRIASKISITFSSCAISGVLWARRSTAGPEGLPDLFKQPNKMKEETKIKTAYFPGIINSCGYCNNPLAPTGMIFSTPFLLTQTTWLKRLLTTHVWFGITVTRSPISGLVSHWEKSTCPCSSDWA